MGCSAALDTVSEYKVHQSRLILSKLCCQSYFFLLKESSLLFAFTPVNDVLLFVCQEKKWEDQGKEYFSID